MEEFKELYEEAILRYGLLEQEKTIEVYKYCIIFRTLDGIEDYLNAKDKKKFILKKISNELALDNTASEDNKRAIVSYLKNRVVDNGYFCHITNSVSAKNIMTYGLNGRGVSHIYDELKDVIPESYFDTDLNYLKSQSEKKEGWFYDRTPYHYQRYHIGPEWFKRLCHGLNKTKDYEGTKDWVTNYIMKNNPEKLPEALELLNKYWNLYIDATPHVLLISNKNDHRSDREKSIDNFDLDTRIEYYTDFFFRISDQNSKIDVSPSEIIDIDVSELKKTQQKINNKVI